jgi:hypothetical protein
MNTLILICALGLARADCSPETAVAVVQGPEVGAPGMCGLHGQAYLAETALADYLDGDHYLKIRCGARPSMVEGEKARRNLALSGQLR